MNIDKKITKRQKYWLAIIKKQGGVAKYYNQFGNEDFFILTSDKKIATKMVKNLILLDLLQPCGDGLFGDSQVYEVANGH